MAAVVAGPVSDPGFAGLAGLRLTRRGRLVVAVLTVLVALTLGGWGVGAVAGDGGEPLEVRLHTVVPGETLWRHASQVAGPGQDVREVVAQIKEINGMRSSDLRVGQVIVLPRD
ncbi:LysM peptidoglycan-binding domain-containing protein [Isoptericola aurantiacus]|uniref:LysM peptidoglycan-binding domain-containing protein n=1 Tax=Isoptericola aurantiacus TaxID=3377839 RepID=UPI00383BDF46